MYRCGVACLLIAMAAARPAGLAVAPPAQPPDGVHAACAVFASDGGSVAATFHADALSADVTDAAGNVSHLTLPFDDASTRYRRTHAWYHTCAVYFDRDSELFAVGLTYGLPDYSVYVAVADAAHLKWLGHWTVGTESGIFIPRLYGFLGRNSQRAKDYAIIGELAARLPPAQELLLTRQAAGARAAVRRRPGAWRRAAAVAGERDAVVVALAREQDRQQRREGGGSRLMRRPPPWPSDRVVATGDARYRFGFSRTMGAASCDVSKAGVMPFPPMETVAWICNDLGH